MLCKMDSLGSDWTKRRKGTIKVASVISTLVCVTLIMQCSIVASFTDSGKSLSNTDSRVQSTNSSTSPRMGHSDKNNVSLWDKLIGNITNMQPFGKSKRNSQIAATQTNPDNSSIQKAFIKRQSYFESLASIFDSVRFKKSREEAYFQNLLQI